MRVKAPCAESPRPTGGFFFGDYICYEPQRLRLSGRPFCCAGCDTTGHGATRGVRLINHFYNSSRFNFNNLLLAVDRLRA